MSGFFNQADRRSSEDDERLAQLYKETSKTLLGFLLRRCPTAEDAADCLAETYRIAWEKRKRLPAGSDGRAWLFGVARNVMREERRSSERQAATRQALALAAENSYIETTVEASALAGALAELSTLDREIVMMLSTDGLSSREVAFVLGLSPTAVRSRAHRARQKLRTLLAQRETGDSAEPPDALLTAKDSGP